MTNHIAAYYWLRNCQLAFKKRISHFQLLTIKLPLFLRAEMNLKAETKDESKLSSFKDGLSARLKKLEESYANRSEAVKAYGLQKGAYERWVYARSSPSVEALAKIAKVAGVSLDWLAFGEEGQTTHERTGWYRYDPPYNYDWMWQIIDMLGDLYRMQGIEPEPDRLLHEAADIYGEASKIADPDERSRAISMATALMAKVIKPADLPKETPGVKRPA